MIHLNDICDPKWHLKCPRNCRPPPWILPKIFIFYTGLTHTFVIPSSKQKHTTGSLTHTHTHAHMTSNNYKQKATGHVTSLANGHFTGSDAPFVCEIPTASSNKKQKDIILLTLDWLWGRPQALLLQRRNVSSVRVGLANGTKQTPSQNWGNLLSELHVPHRQCLTG